MNTNELFEAYSKTCEIQTTEKVLVAAAVEWYKACQVKSPNNETLRRGYLYDRVKDYMDAMERVKP